MTEYKRDFGSFHASNVQETISLSEDQYIAPKFLIDVPSFTDIEKDFKFGKICRKKHFYLEDDCTFLNHGAFGGVLKEAMETAQKWQIYTERQPLRFFDRELIPHLDVTQLTLYWLPMLQLPLTLLSKELNYKKGIQFIC